jgi:hypothetical protein
VIFPLILRLDCGQQLLQPKHFEDEEQAIRIDQQGRKVLHLDDVYVWDLSVADVGRCTVSSRDALNHFISNKMMAETALDVISRCLAISTSSKDNGAVF